jgi:hypothetical protein
MLSSTEIARRALDIGLDAIGEIVRDSNGAKDRVAKITRRFEVR